MIFNIQKFSVHDGPGIRTTVFFKGCPLSCWWCHNPESQLLKSEMMYNNTKCINCHTCDGLTIEEQCKVCPSCAKEMIGRNYEVNALVKILLQDEVFYEQSGGGVTFSGGEPMLHVDYMQEVIQLLKKNKIHIALDTTGYVQWHEFEKILKDVDLFLYDIKHLDSKKHVELTGVDNKLILENLISLSKSNQNIVVRVPVVPGYNDDKDYIDSLGEWLKSYGLKQVNLLPYHRVAIDKYKRLEREYLRPEVEEPTHEEMVMIQSILKSYELDVSIGG